MDKLEEIQYYRLSKEIWDSCWNDIDLLKKDIRGIEVSKQLIRAVGSIGANIEEGFGRGFGKEYPQFLRISRGSAREARGWYYRSRFLLSQDILAERDQTLSSIIAMITRAILTLEEKNRNKV